MASEASPNRHRPRRGATRVALNRSGGTHQGMRPPGDDQHVEFLIGEFIDAAALDPRNWCQVADQMQRSIPGVKPVIQAHDPSFGRPLVAVAAGWSEGYFEPY